ncbi:hypothetical protein [Streptomyces himalayensis]|uniref:Uncharacterized protein n=1 Tax=Streptomyces himalayensis subsp. himalayensis TaxID=2756131 RepID=A0A7W0DUF1_9ACTN|nr:hypothetical protein [Streptomyces himalayensis]MBA2951466.1 hypothetical protein [Streptomyces himalayensis subsp. himalayensis]
MDPTALLGPLALASMALGYMAGRLSLVSMALLSSEKDEEYVPLDDPRRDPGWCHTHDMHRDDEDE